MEWRDGQPYSRHYQDVYFSRESGLEETRHVFLRSNRLEQRWRALAGDETFVIGETGFGTGLNFLAAWQLWDQVAARGRLHYFSFEQQPLTLQTLSQALQLWPELAPWRELFCARYGVLTDGWHRFVFRDGQVNLTLLVGDVSECLARFAGHAHAWFLDGFAPAKNPRMWSDEVLAGVAKHSAAGATFATYTSAGAVRRALQAVGFTVNKSTGFGRKREMLSGEYADGAQPTHTPGDRQAIVVGGGIAGCATSRALAQAGWQVTLLDSRLGLAQAASGLSQAVLHPRLPSKMTTGHWLSLLGFQYALRHQDIAPAHGEKLWHPCGTIQLDHVSRRQLDAASVESLGVPTDLIRRVHRAEASDIAGVPLESGGLYCPQGGWLEGAPYCNSLARHSAITLESNCSIGDLAWLPADKMWRATAEDGRRFQAGKIVIANAYDALRLRVIEDLPLYRVRGQISLLPGTTYSKRLATVLCGEGVLTPAHRGVHCVGASFNRDRFDLLASDEEHVSNRAMLQRLAPGLFQASAAFTGAFVALRCTTSDRLPVAGEVALREASGLYVNLAHGSKGFSTAPLLGELIASKISGAPLPLSTDMVDACSPGRFLTVD